MLAGKCVMDKRLINPVLDSVDDVFEILIKEDVKRGELKTKARNEFILKKSIAGIMNLSSNNAKASVAIIFPEDLIFNISNKVMPEPVKRINEVVIDLVGEITNMVAGGVKGKLEAEGYLFDLSLPTIILGSEYLLAHLPQTTIVQADLLTELGEFTIEACFDGEPDFCPLNVDLPEEFEDILF